jgi:hypothetical protein
MSTRKWRTALRRAATVVAGTTVLAVVGAGVAAAAVSPSNDITTSSTELYWSGQGTPVQQLCGTSADPGANPAGFTNGSGPNDYELWIFSPDGGSVVGSPTLTVNGTTYDNAFHAGPFTDSNGIVYDHGAWQIVTPYIDPSTIQQAPKTGGTGSAFASFVVNTIGGGSWVLTISHGCAGNTGPPAADALTVSKTVTGDYTTTWPWTLAKSADATQVTNSDGQHQFVYTVTATHGDPTNSAVTVQGDITVHNPNTNGATDPNHTPTLVDTQLSDGTACHVDPLPSSLPPGDTTVHYTCDPDNSFNFNSPPTNKATLSWDTQTLSDGSLLSGNQADTGDVAINPLTPHLVGDSTTITDPNAVTNANPSGQLGTVSVNDPNGQQFSYSVNYNDPAGKCTSHDNTAHFTASGGGAPGDSNKVTVTQCVGADLTVSKTATPTFDRTYGWNISKAVDKTRVEQVGGQATFNYTVTMGHDQGTDAHWKVAGNITASNPNDWESVALTGVADAIDNGGNCSITSGDPKATLAPKGQPGDSVVLGYQCTYSSRPDYSALFTNTATASWDKSAASTPNGSADGTATGRFSDATPTIKDDQVSVTDPLSGNPQDVLGTVGLGDPNPKQFTYSHTVSVPQFNCTTVNNTATFTTNTTGTTGSDSKTVYACGPAKTGALTMGFWQNKNGQGVITGQAPTGTCPSGTWLRQYAPFQDLSATATCAQVGTYVTNVIKAASASGAAMNAMLKAQILSTALDVYFGGGPGGNKIGAPVGQPVGDQVIDLTKICKMIDGSGGTATCSGTYENVGPAFGNPAPTSMKVSDMLAYAASQSNSGGSSWYSQVKATQQLAKDAFDAINNQVAFGA